MSTAAVEALRQDLPSAEVHVLTRDAFREVFDGNPGVACVVGWAPSRRIADVARELHSRRYDWVVDLHANLRTRLLRLLLPGPRWSVYAKGSVQRRLAVALHRPSLLGRRHVVDRYIEALSPLGAVSVRRMPHLYVGDAERRKAEGLIRGAGWDGTSRLVGLAPGAKWATKVWPEERWVDLLRLLRDRKPGFVVLVGGPGEERLCGEILGAAGGVGADLAGQTSILETAAALGLCDVLVTNDSAPLHVATAVGTPVVALFGPTVHGFGFYPLGARDVILEGECPLRPCALHGGPRCPRGTHACLREIEVSEVLEAVTASAHRAQRDRAGE